MKIAVIGGSGKLGLGFVTRLRETRHEVAIGSRDIAKGMPYADAAAWCDAAIVTVPYAAHTLTLAPLKDALSGKVVIDATVPLNPKNIFEIVTETGKSAAQETDTLLGSSHVFGAFQTISHRVLQRIGHVEDVLVAGGDDRKQDVLQLIRDMSLRPVDAGPLDASAILERMTVLLISINKANKVKECSLKVTGI